MEAVLISAGLVALAETGDKTQVLAVVLAARFRAPVIVTLGILCATALNHLLAAALGTLIGDWLGQNLRWILAVSFAALGLWTLVPDRLDRPQSFDRFGAFGASLLSFFLIEMGDKTQLATMALAARFHAVIPVAVGTTLGMMIADVPAVLVGNFLAARLPLKPLRLAAAGLFLVLAFAAALDFGRGLLP